MAVIDITHLQGWVGRETRAEDALAAFPARALAGLLDHAQVPVAGDPLPLCWQWLYFLDAPARASLGADGHPRRGDFLPPVPLPRRMWAAGRMEVDRPLIIGTPAQRVSRVRSVEGKTGRSGALVFVIVDHEFHQGGRRCLREAHHIVYRDTPAAAATSAAAPVSPSGEAAAPDAQWSIAVVPDPVLLFRYSALTYNGHRIHYDRDYATGQEHYPGLVVHGPLLATLLVDTLRQAHPATAIRDFEFRAERPAFDGAPLRLCGRVDGGKAQLWTADAQGRVGMRASAAPA